MLIEDFIAILHTLNFSEERTKSDARTTQIEGLERANDCLINVCLNFEYFLDPFCFEAITAKDVALNEHRIMLEKVKEVVIIV